MNQRKSDDLECLHQNVADYEDVIDCCGGGVETGSERAGTKVGGRGVVVLFSVVEGEEEEDGQ